MYVLFLVSIVFNGNVRNSSTIFSVSLFITIKQCTMIHHLSRTLNIFEEYEIVHFLQGYLNSTLTLSYFFLVYLVKRLVGRLIMSVTVMPSEKWIFGWEAKLQGQMWNFEVNIQVNGGSCVITVRWFCTTWPLNSRLSRAKFNEKVITWNIFVN